jgi:hypothetical protein
VRPADQTYMRKLFIVPFLGRLPEWIDAYRRNCELLTVFGFEWLICNDATRFSALVEHRLGITFPTKYKDQRKPCDLRPAYGHLFSEYLQGYDYWGHTDLDVAYGRLDKFVSDEVLTGCDIFSNDPGTICGPFSLFRNNEMVNNLFRRSANWKDIFSSPAYHNFDEDGFSSVVNSSKEVAVRYEFWQRHDNLPEHRVPSVRFEEGSLYDGTEEIMMFHFPRTKKWPCR